MLASLWDIYRIQADACLVSGDQAKATFYLDQAMRLEAPVARVVEQYTLAKLPVVRAKLIICQALDQPLCQAWLSFAEAATPAPVPEAAFQAALALLLPAISAMMYEQEEWKEWAPLMILYAHTCQWAGDHPAARDALQQLEVALMDGHCTRLGPLVAALVARSR
jgi:hypothetical protein